MIFSTGVVAALLISPLEYAYPQLGDARAHEDVQHIVVLTAFAADDREMPLTGRFSASTAYRVLMALEIYSERPDCDIVVSGDASTARIMAEALIKLGAPPNKVRIEGASATTADSAANLRPIVGVEKFFLVTSAGHMPRTMAAFDRANLNAVPAPTDHQLPRNWITAELRSRPTSLLASDRALHEYLGAVWYRLRSAL